MRERERDREKECFERDSDRHREKVTQKDRNVK